MPIVKIFTFGSATEHATACRPAILTPTLPGMNSMVWQSALTLVNADCPTMEFIPGSVGVSMAGRQAVACSVAEPNVKIFTIGMQALAADSGRRDRYQTPDRDGADARESLQ